MDNAPDNDLNEMPSQEDMDASWRPDEGSDVGWTEDKQWTTRRIILVAIVIIALVAFIALTAVGFLQFFLNPSGAVPTPTPVLPMI